MKNSKFYLILFIIISFGAFLRIYSLDKIPSHLGNDEISIAYDSYSIRTTGRDEYGIKLPLSFKSHRDYKAPLYTYLNVPFNYLFGNNEYGLRFLSALSGTLMIFVIAIFGKVLVGSELGLSLAVLMATNPKSIYVSRMSYEANLASLLVLIGVFLMYRYKLYRKKTSLLLSGISLGFSIWAYHTQKGLVPLIITILPLIWYKKIRLREWLLLWLTVLLLILPIFWDFVYIQMRDPYNRASSQIWFKGAAIEKYIKETDDGFIKKSFKVLSDPVYRYFEHFNIDYNFTNGLDLLSKNEPLNFGWFLLCTLPVLIVGLFNLKKIYGDNSFWILAWWLLTPIIPSLTYGELSAVRNLTFIPPTLLIMSAGVLIILNKKNRYRFIYLILFVINFLYFIVSYYYHFPMVNADRFQYGYKQSFEFIKPFVSDYNKIIVEPRFGEFGQHVGLPRLYFGYFGAYDSNEMLKRNDKTGEIGKYQIKTVDWNNEKLEPKTIYIVSIFNKAPDMVEDKLTLLTTIRNPDGRGQFLIYSF